MDRVGPQHAMGDGGGGGGWAATGAKIPGGPGGKIFWVKIY